MSLTLRMTIPTLALLVGACGPKAESDDGGETTEVGGDSTGSGPDGATTGGASDPTSPTSASGGSSASTSAGTSASTSASTTASETTAGTTADPSDTGNDPVEEPPIEPPQPCEGEASPIEVTTAFAYLQSQIPPEPNPSGTSTTGGEPPDPSTLHIKLSDQKFACEDPSGILECGPHWEVTIVIPPEFQFPGLYNLVGPDVHGFSSESGKDEGMGQCGFGGGTFEATLEILAVDDQQVEGRLCHVQGFFFETMPDLEGTFVAPRCP